MLNLCCCYSDFDSETLAVLSSLTHSWTRLVQPLAVVLCWHAMNLATMMVLSIVVATRTILNAENSIENLADFNFQCNELEIDYLRGVFGKIECNWLRNCKLNKVWRWSLPPADTRVSFGSLGWLFDRFCNFSSVRYRHRPPFHLQQLEKVHYSILKHNNSLPPNHNKFKVLINKSLVYWDFNYKVFCLTSTR